MATSESRTRARATSVIRPSSTPTPGTAELLVAATHLRDSQYESAFDLYTKVLVNLSHGSPVALIGRALAQLALCRPALAATDAWRAVLICESLLRDTGPDIERRMRDIGSYLGGLEMAEDLWKWTTGPSCYLRAHGSGDGLSVRLAAIGWGAPRFAGSGSTAARGRSKQSSGAYLKDLLHSALYRLGLSLWRCGGGARMDALDIVEWGFNACAKGSEDEETFLWLGNRILEEVGGEMQVEEDAARARGPWTAEIVEELDKTGVREAMRTRLAVLKLDRSSWDERQTATPLDRINEYMASITNNCEMRVVRPEGGSSEYALFATRDIFPGEIVLQEEPAMAVTIKLHSGPAENCENCATRLVTSEKQDVPVLNDNEPLPTEPALTQETAGAATERRIESSPATGDGELNAGIWDGAHGDGDAMDIDGDDRVDDNAVSNGARIADGVMAIDAHTDAMKSPDGQVDEPPDDFLGPRLCPDCRTAAFCSRLCHEVGHHLYHRVLCDKDLVEWVADLIPDWPGTSARHGLYTSTPARSRLYCVMLARALVMGSTYEIDAVEMAGILFGDSRVRFQDPAAGSEVPCGLTTGHSSSIHHAGNANSIDWSFLTHVSVPLRILDLIGMDGAASVEYCDGWMINNLLDKMAQFASVTSASRQINFYNLEGKLTDVCVAKDLLDEYDDGRVLIGTVHPAIGLVQQVTKAEGGNVRRIDGTDAKLQALQTTKNDTDGRAGLDDADAEVAPAIRAGDRILIVGNDGDMRVNEDGLGQAGLGNPELDSKTVTPDTSSPASDRKLDIHVGC